MAPQSGAGYDGLRSLPNAGNACVPPNVNGSVYEATLRLTCRFRKSDPRVSTAEPTRARMYNDITDTFNHARIGSILARYWFFEIIIGCDSAIIRRECFLVEHDQTIRALAPD